MLIDSHCHFNFLSPQQKEAVISSCLHNYLFIDSSTDSKTTQIALDLSGKHSFIYTSLGFHPFWAKDFSPSIIEKYRELIRGNNKIVAIGEVGLDHKAPVSLDKQEEILREFIKLAIEFNLPLVLHNRMDSFRLLSILDDFFSSYEKVILHCFSYFPSFLKEVIKRRGFVSFSLNILRKKKDIISSLEFCPLNSLFLETDSPYMKINTRPSTPLDIKEVYSFAAGVKKIKEEELEEIIFANAKRVFKLE